MLNQYNMYDVNSRLKSSNYTGSVVGKELTIISTPCFLTTQSCSTGKDQYITNY